MPTLKKQKSLASPEIEEDINTKKIEYFDVALEYKTGHLVAISRPGKMKKLLKTSLNGRVFKLSSVWIETVYLSELAVPGEVAVVIDGLYSPYNFAYPKPVTII